MNCIKYILSVLFTTFVLSTKAQLILGTNLVNNPSFEEYYSCPIGYGEIDSCKYWWGFSSDYYNACTTTSFISVPSNGPGFQYAHTGNAYAGCAIYCMDIYGDDYRESIKTKLNDSLIVNKRYCTNFYVSIAEGSYSDNLTCTLLDSIGMLFTKYMVQDNVLPILNNGIKVQNSIKSIDTINWSKITNTFIAGNTAKYLTLGNFDTFIFWPPHSDAMMYVYMDDVSVCECSFKFNLGNDTTLCIGESLILKPNMPNATYTWQDGSNDSTYKVTQAGTYWVSAYFPDYNITTYDTINIMYKDCDTTEKIIPDIYIPNSFTPNGDGKNDVFNIKTVYEFSEFKLVIYNRWGDMIFESEDINKGWDGTYKVKPVPLGVYVYQLTATIKDTGEQRKITGRVTLVR